MSRPVRIRRSAEQWRALLDEQADSGLRQEVTAPILVPGLNKSQLHTNRLIHGGHVHGIEYCEPVSESRF